VAHAALDFAITFPAAFSDWHASSNTLLVLAVPDELSLGWLCDDAAAADLRVVRFHEPDLGGALTAAALEPAAARLVARFPLALSRVFRSPPSEPSSSASGQPFRAPSDGEEVRK
jgi:hypothetical protein